MTLTSLFGAPKCAGKPAWASFRPSARRDARRRFLRRRGVILLLGRSRTPGFLVKADDVSRGIAESRGDLGRIGPDGLHELAAVGKDGVDGRGHAVDHEVDEQARLRRRRPADYPRAAHFAGRIVECDVTIAALPDPPAENLGVEVGRTLEVDRGQLDVANLAVRKRRGHGKI